MKLLINEETFEESDKVILRLVKSNSGDVHLMAHKEGWAEQIILKFTTGGAINKIIVDGDVGFALDEKRLVII